jgi:hypothetical protein
MQLHVVYSFKSSGYGTGAYYRFWRWMEVFFDSSRCLMEIIWNYSSEDGITGTIYMGILAAYVLTILLGVSYITYFVAFVWYFLL